jgi:general secretion pathway protein A
MYLSFFGMREQPFSITPDPKFLFLTQSHESAREALLYGIRAKKGFLLLTGEVGTGKTTLCREIINEIEDDSAISVVLNPMLSTLGLLKTIVKDFGLSVQSNSIDDAIESLYVYLLSLQKQGKNAVLIIDEAQNLSTEALESVRLLSNLETDKEKLIQILLIGQPELNETLSHHQLRQLNQRISIRAHLVRLTVHDIDVYIRHRLMIAGTHGSIVFEKSALKAIYKYSAGLPRLINKLCDRVLLAAFVEGQRRISAKLVKTACIDLQGEPVVQPWWRLWACR